MTTTEAELTCKWCEIKKNKLNEGACTVRDTAEVTTYPCAAHLMDAVWSALVTTDKVVIEKINP